MIHKISKTLYSSLVMLLLFCILLTAGCSHTTGSHAASNLKSGQEKSPHTASTPYTASYQIDLPSKAAPSVKIDLAQHDSEHHSDVFLIKTMEDAGIKNIGLEPLKLRIKTSGFPEKVTFKTTVSFDPEQGVIRDPLEPGESIKLDFETSVSEKPADSAQICNGYVHFINENTGREIGALNVIILDSKINNGQVKAEEDCCAIE